MGKCLFMRKGEIHTSPVPSKFQFYNNGDECEGVTGGWESIPLAYEQAYNTPVAPVITRNSKTLTLTQTVVAPQYYQCGMVKTTKKIPMAGATAVHFSLRATSSAANQIVRLHVAPSIGNYVVDTPGNYLTIFDYAHGPIEGVYTVNVSGITDDCYIGISIYQDCVVEVSSIWAE